MKNTLNLTIKRIMSVLLFIATGLTCFAQTPFSGIVKDTSGEPLIGVSVMWGEGQGTSTDLDGQFRIEVREGTKLTFSYMGFRTISAVVHENMAITMEEDVTTLEDVVVIGYGTTSRKDLTGSVSSIRGDELSSVPVADVAQAIQGQIAGVSVTSQDGRPGGNTSIRIRGGGSITQSNDPLFVVDGVVVSDISDIPADNIASIDVLKDAASTAIYGARGANGIILITTKSSDGEKKVKINYNMYYQLKTNARKLQTLNAYDYVRYTWAYAQAYGDSYGDNVAKYFGLGSAYGNHLEEYRDFKVHDYVDEIVGNAGSWNHDVTLSGGTSWTKYYASFNYSNDGGLLRNTGFNRWNANIKVSQKILENLHVDADIRYTERRYKGVKDMYELATSAYRFRPIDVPLGEDKTSYFGNGDTYMELSNSPTAVLNNYQNMVKRIRLMGTIGLTWVPVKGLTAKTEASFGRYWNETNYWDGGHFAGYTTARLTQGKGSTIRWTTTLSYQVQGLGDAHRLSFLAGNELLSGQSSTSHIYGSGYSKLYNLDVAMARLSLTDSSLGRDEFGNVVGVPTRTLSWFGRINYDLLDRYLLTVTFRADGSSKFAPKHHWGYFPAVAAAWRISEEPFMQGTSNWLDNLKLRLSWGMSGSDNIDASLWQNGLWTSTTITIDGVPTNIYKPAEMMGNENLKWEKTISRNIGLDFGFWNGRLRGSIEGYCNTTKDILMRVPVDATTGYSYQYQNIGQTSNKGVELSLHADLYRSKDLTVGINVTYNYNKNNIDQLAPEVIADTHTDWGSTMRKPYYDYVIRCGQPVGSIYGFVSDGFYTVDDFDMDEYNSTGTWQLRQGIPDLVDVANYATGGQFNNKAQNAFPGMVKFKDINGDGVVNNDDATIIGHTIPEHTGGINLFLTWKGLDFSAGFVYQIGGNVYNANAMYSMMGNKDISLGANRLSFVADAWKMYDVNAAGDLVAVTDPDGLRALNANTRYGLPYYEAGIVSSDFIEDASYLRLNALTLGYTFPDKWMQKAKISKLRIYFTGGNLFCIAGYSGLDPDVNTMPVTAGFPTPAYDYLSYPKARTFTFGFNLAFF